jgi:hypothetical protein
LTKLRTLESSKNASIKLLLIRYFIEILDTDYVDEYLEAKVIILLASEA